MAVICSSVSSGRAISRDLPQARTLRDQRERLFRGQPQGVDRGLALEFSHLAQGRQARLERDQHLLPRRRTALLPPGDPMWRAEVEQHSWRALERPEGLRAHEALPDHHDARIAVERDAGPLLALLRQILLVAAGPGLGQERAALDRVPGALRVARRLGGDPVDRAHRADHRGLHAPELAAAEPAPLLANGAPE